MSIWTTRPLIEDMQALVAGTLLESLDIIVSCQGGGYTEKAHPQLRRNGWQGFWIDAASTLRMEQDALIVLDPVNRGVIDRALENAGGAILLPQSQMTVEKVAAMLLDREFRVVARFTEEDGILHNRIDGALEIAHLPDTFVSEEITTYFPEDRCKLHVLALDITERQHADIQHCRDNVFYLVDYLRAQGIVHVVAHPLYGVNDRLSIEHFEKMLLLFKNFEMNGARNDVANDGLEAVLKALSPDMIEALGDRHGIDPAFPEPWKKNITGGSDDHSALNIARTYTEIHGAESLREGLAGLENGQSRAVRHPSLPETMAHNFYSIAYQYYRSKFNLERFQGKDLLIKFLDRSLRPNGCGDKGHDGRLIDKVYCFFNAHRRTRPEPVSDDLIGLLRHTTARLLKDDRQFKRLALTGAQNDLPPEIGWFDFVNQVSNQALINFANHAMNHLVGGNVFNIFHTLGSAGGLYGLLAPYFIAFSLFSKDREFTQNVRDHFGVPSPANAGIADAVRVGHFTDTFYDTNGVALTLQQQVQVALRHGDRVGLLAFDGDPLRRIGRNLRHHPGEVRVRGGPTAAAERPHGVPDHRLGIAPSCRPMAHCSGNA